MSKSFALSLVLVLGLIAPVSPTIAQEEVKSLRGELALGADSKEPEIRNWAKDRDPIPRDFIQQPPLVPHSIKGYKINLKTNKCLSCHSWTTYKKAGATKISQTHFADRTANVMADVAARRYFCTQCHVPQTDAAPLVQNEFEPLHSVKE
ncbi:MAG: nitrate reductase cytochrome c-type subunit [Pseudomonadales bacterium]|nr:nitrate reductase cytochrome c-type subunit [Pseudomonadales bacterium]